MGVADPHAPGKFTAEDQNGAALSIGDRVTYGGDPGTVQQIICVQHGRPVYDDGQKELIDVEGQKAQYMVVVGLDEGTEHRLKSKYVVKA